MNILVPDAWLREFLKTKATPKQIKEYVSLCGPSVERVSVVNGEVVYDIEVTTNRPDAMSVVGIAREAAAILPRFGVKATLVGDPYKEKLPPIKSKNSKPLAAIVDHTLCPRFTTVVFENIKVGPSPAWLTKKLEQTGVRSINNVVDITNYVMKAYGQPCHVFDYDAVGAKNGLPTMILRASKKGEKITTLDGKTHELPGGDIIIEDGKGKIIDLCGIMGGENSQVTETTTNVILFVQTYDPTHIRKTSMALAHRTEASGLFEKGLDSELVTPVLMKGIVLLEELASGVIASKIYDQYPKPYKPVSVICSRQKLDAYIGKALPSSEISAILTNLGFVPTVTKHEVKVAVPSFRRDVTIDVDIIEEIARIHGYHNIASKLPESEPPIVIPNKTLVWEEEIKIRLRDWGYTETYTYSMISEKLMDIFGLDKTNAYKISNPLSEEWVYMRPSIVPSIVEAIEQNLHYRDSLQLFELSMTYQYNEGNLPTETPMLVVTATDDAFFILKGLAETILALFRVPFPNTDHSAKSVWFDANRSLTIGDVGELGVITDDIRSNMLIKKPVAVLTLDIGKLVSQANIIKTYTPIPKYPPVVEDISFVVNEGSHVGPMTQAIQAVNPLITNVQLLDVYENTRTFHITYLDPNKNLTNEDVKPIHEKIISEIEQQFGATIKSA